MGSGFEAMKLRDRIYGQGSDQTLLQYTFSRDRLPVGIWYPAGLQSSEVISMKVEDAVHYKLGEKL